MVCTQRIGDVLLATPLAKSLKATWPDAFVDFLVLPGTDGILQGNPDIRRVLVFPQRVGWREKISQLAHIWRRYDLAIAATPTDRARIFAWAASTKSLGFVTDEKYRWMQRRFLDVALQFDNLDTHTVSSYLSLLRPLGVPPRSTVQNPGVDTQTWQHRTQQLAISEKSGYVVLHPNPKFQYKMWTPEKWVALASWFRQCDREVFLTGSSDPAEAAYVEQIATRVTGGCRNMAGLLSLAETAEFLRTAAMFVGPDTAVTHMAAASGIPTIALFGPSNPVKWGPWPVTWQDEQSPWQRVGSERRGNVWLLQGQGECVPCLLEGCDRHINSSSRCLQEISVERVKEAAGEMLARSPEASESD